MALRGIFILDDGNLAWLHAAFLEYDARRQIQPGPIGGCDAHDPYESFISHRVCLAWPESIDAFWPTANRQVDHATRWTYRVTEDQLSRVIRHLLSCLCLRYDGGNIDNDRVPCPGYEHTAPTSGLQVRQSARDGDSFGCALLRPGLESYLLVAGPLTFINATASNCRRDPNRHVPWARHGALHRRHTIHLGLKASCAPFLHPGVTLLAAGLFRYASLRSTRHSACAMMHQTWFSSLCLDPFARAQPILWSARARTGCARRRVRTRRRWRRWRQRRRSRRNRTNPPRLSMSLDIRRKVHGAIRMENGYKNRRHRVQRRLECCLTWARLT